MVLKHGETSMEMVDAAVQDGAWRIKVEQVPESVYVTEAWFDGAAVRGTSVMRVDDPKALALRGRLVPTLTVRVFADESGQELSGVCVATRPLDDHKRLHPGNEGCEVRARNQASPVRFGTRSIASQQTFWVAAPSRAWQPIEMFTTRAHERFVSLEPGGDVLVTCTGMRRTSNGSKLRIYANQSREPICEVAPQPGGTKIEHLPTGSLRLALEMGRWSRTPHVLASANIQVRVGQLCRVELKVAAEPKVFRAAAAGTLLIGESWGDNWSLQLVATGHNSTQFATNTTMSRSAMQEGPPREYSWRISQLSCGTYQVFVRGPNYRTVLTIPAGGVKNARIVVPEPATIELRVVDRDGKEPSPDDSLPVWRHVADSGANRFASTKASLQTDGSYRIVTPAGKVHVQWHPEGYGRASREFLVGPGTHQVQLEIERECGFEIVWKEGSIRIPWPLLTALTIRNASGELVPHRVAESRVITEESGALTLSIPPIAGYLPIPDLNVFVDPGGWAKAEVQLVRKY